MSELAPAESIKEFFDLWSIYDLVLDWDDMMHRELYAEIGRALAARFEGRAFSVLDLGCGSGRHLAPTLQAFKVSRYEGHDLSSTAITHARKNFSVLACPQRFGQGDLREALQTDGPTFDLIFSGFTFHHFTAQERAEIVRSARRRLAPGGMLLLLDLMRDEGETRERFLDAYCSWIETDWREIPKAGAQAIVGHVRAADQPGTLAEFDAAARAAGFARSRLVYRARTHCLCSCE